MLQEPKPSSMEQYSDDQFLEFSRNRIWIDINDGMKEREAQLLTDLRHSTKIDEINSLQGALRELEKLIDYPLKFIEFRKVLTDAGPEKD